MRIAINLASHPYLELGPLYKRLRILIVALALLAVPLWLLLRAESAKSSAAHQHLAAAQQNLEALQHQEQTYEAEMRQPGNASVLRQSQFLNGVFVRKAFSWTAVMMDLEKVLPGGVQVLNIDPVISRDGGVTIRLRVSGQRDRAVALVRNLEHSRSFLFPRLADEAAETASQGGRSLDPVSAKNNVNFDILAQYNPLPLPVAGSKEKTGQKTQTDSAAKSAPRHRTVKTTGTKSGDTISASSSTSSKPLAVESSEQPSLHKAGPR